jgi:hypothetical protein
MQYSQEVVINLPLQKVAALFNDPANAKYWRPTPLSVEHISGTPGQVGAKTKLKFKRFEILETITDKEEPAGFTSIGDVGHLMSKARFSFKSLRSNETVYRMDIEYTFRSLRAKLLGIIFPGMFKKQTMEYMEKFKHFAENTAMSSP